MDQRLRFVTFAATVMTLAAALVPAQAVIPREALAERRAAASAGPPPGVLVSRHESTTGNRVERGCGVSAPLPADAATSVWLFCDIEVREPDGDLVQFLPGTIASLGPAAPGEVPDPLSEVPSPPASISFPNDNPPQPLLTPPTDLACPSGSYATVRPTGVTRGPGGTLHLRNGTTPVDVTNSQNVLVISYIEACAEDDVTIAAKRFGVAAWRPSDNTVPARFTVFDPPGDGNVPWYQELGSPIFDPVTFGGATEHAYFFASHCDQVEWLSCGQGRVFLVGVPLLAGEPTLPDPARYRYWAPSRAGRGPDGQQQGWTTADQAESILPPGMTLGPGNLAVNDFRWVSRQNDPAYKGRGKGLMLVEQLNLAGSYRLWQAETPTGTWTMRASGSTGCVVCGPLTAHPALSSPTGLVASHFRMADRSIEVIGLGDLPIDSAPPGANVTSNWERHHMVDLARECGWSAPLPKPDPADPPTESVWIFCDQAPVFSSAREDSPWFAAFIGTFIGVGPITPGRVPTAMSDGGPTSARPHNGGPGGVIGTVDGTIPGPQGQPCGTDLSGNGKADSVPIRWGWGVTRAPEGTLTVDPHDGPPTQVEGARLLVVPFNDVCGSFGIDRQGTLADLHVKRSGVAIYDAVSGSLLAKHIVFESTQPDLPTPTAPWSPDDLGWPFIWSGPVFHGGHLYLFSGECDLYIEPYGPNQGDKCNSGKVYAVRVPKDQIHDRSQYQWHTGPAGSDTWTTDVTEATSLLPATSPTRGPVGFGGQIYVGDYSSLGKGFLLIEPTSWLGHYRVWQAAAPDEPWQLVRAEGDVMAGCEPDWAGQPRTTAACYNFGGHPELSTADHLLVSHIQPDISMGDDDTAQYDVETVDIGTVADLP